jgi:hypothetical protein
MGGAVGKRPDHPNARAVDTSGKGMGMGAGSYEISEQDKNFRTLVYQKRRLSDTTLAKVMSDPVVSTAFRAFLHGEFGEQKLAFWVEQDQYRQLPPGAGTPLKDRQAAAERMYNRYINASANSTFDIELDTATRDAIKTDLLVKKGEERDGETWWRVTQTDGTTLERAFLLAGAKTFQNIKFTYLPVFLSSSHFESLRGNEGYFKDIDDAVRKAGDFLHDMKMEFIMQHPLGQHYLLNFVKSTTVLGGKGSELVYLYMELEHFAAEAKAADRSTRLGRVAKRYAQLSSVPALSAVLQQYKDKPEQFAEPPQNLLHEAQQQVVALFDAIEKDFKQDSLFKQMADSITTSSVQDYSKVKKYSERNRTKETIAMMNNFIEARNLHDRKDEELTLDKVLATSQGLCYFRKFAHQNFMEDSIEFWDKVDKFKQECAESPNDKALLRRSGQPIVDMHLAPGSQMVINVSHAMIQETLDAFQNDKTLTVHIFDKAHAEVFALMRNNLWKKFQATPRFAYLQERAKEKEILRETQGRVGQTVLAG